VEARHWLAQELEKFEVSNDNPTPAPL
jgi:hypothetical protein